MNMSDSMVKDIAEDIVLNLLVDGVEFLDVIEHPRMMDADSLERDNTAVYDKVNEILEHLKQHIYI